MLLPGNLGFWHLPAKQRLYRATNIPETMLMTLWLKCLELPFSSFFGRRGTQGQCGQSYHDVKAVPGDQLRSQTCL